MLRRILTNRLAATALGTAVVALVALVAVAAGAPRDWTLVAALTAGTPFLNLSGFGRPVDTERYLAARGEDGALRDGGLSVVVALLAGALAVGGSTLVGLEGGVRVAVVAAGTFAGGNAAFLARNREFVSRTGFRTDPPEPEQGEREN
jgi:hypothetical protein